MRERFDALRHVPLSTVGVTLLMLGFAGGLLISPLRWSATPAYGNLLLIMSAQAWGLVYLLGAALLILGLAVSKLRAVSLAAHMITFVLMLSWEVAFIIRTATDNKTTIANVIAWLTYSILVVVSARRIDDWHTVDSELE